MKLYIYHYFITSFLYPKQLLSRHYWQPQQYENFLKQDTKTRRRHYLPLVREVGRVALSYKAHNQTGELISTSVKVDYFLFYSDLRKHEKGQIEFSQSLQNFCCKSDVIHPYQQSTVYFLNKLHLVPCSVRSETKKLKLNQLSLARSSYHANRL